MDKDKELLFWYWLPVAATGVVLTLSILTGLGAL